MKNCDVILALDPGSKCGWAIRYNNGTFASGTSDLRHTRFQGAGMRWVNLRRFLRHLIESVNIDLIVYEEVRRHLGTDAAHIYGGIVAIIQEMAECAKIPYTAIPVGTIKKHATGKGNASKVEMFEAAKIKWPEWDSARADDNEADALWILDKAITEYSKTQTPPRSEDVNEVVRVQVERVK